MSFDEPEDIWVKLDALAHQFLSLTPAWQFRVATTLAEQEAIYRLRYQEVIERGWASPEDFPDGLEQDVYDATATQIGVWEGEVLIATTRLIYPTADEPIPVESEFQVRFEPQGQVVYISRIVIAPAYRGQEQHSLFLGLLSISWLEIRAKGFSHLCGVIAESVMPFFKRMGLQLKPIGEPRTFWGEIRYACQIDMYATARRLLGSA